MEYHKWQCDECTGTGFIETDEKDSVESIRNKISAAHKEDRPQCGFRISLLAYGRRAPEINSEGYIRV